MRAAAPVALRIAEVLGVTAESVQPVGGGSICRAYQVRLGDGDTVFAKTLDGATPDFFAAEVKGLRMLRSTGTVPVPEVLASTDDLIVLDWIEPGAPSAAQAERLGRDLAALHATPAPRYGTAHPAYIGSLPLPSPDYAVTAPDDWPGFHVEYRLLPYLRQAVDNGSMPPAARRAVEQVCNRFADLCGPVPPPTVIHGDLWSGNVHWARDGRARLIDPATQGGHPEADLAMLELFGCPQLGRLISAYEEARPTPGRRERVPLHQLHLLLFHAARFGSGFGDYAGTAARLALANLG